MIPGYLIALNWLYILGYVVDVVSMIVQGIQMYWAASLAGWSRELLFNSDFRAPSGLTRSAKLPTASNAQSAH